MQGQGFFSVLKNNFECLMCKDGKSCPMRYSPDHKIRTFEIYQSCEKEKEKKEKKAFGKKII